MRRIIAIAITAAASVLGIQSTARTATAPASAQEGTVEVVRVLDGDTVVVAGWKERVRLANIDAPEKSHGYGKPGQPFSVQASRWLERELQGKPGVTIRCVDSDRYGRKVCNFYRAGQHVNKEIVRSGLAWANTSNRRYLRDRSVLDAQREAEAARRGLWADNKPVEPWNWRHECWERRVCAAH